jgi:D-psicose/D-tagatose/L-ribulose 3-epimerase
MTQLSISNLAFPDIEIETIAPILWQAGIRGIEIAPTVVWENAPKVTHFQAREYVEKWRSQGFAISGIQSLLYGHAELQILDRNSWPNLYEHLSQMIKLASELETHVAVFGSPRNRVRGNIPIAEANEICAEFLSTLLPVLSKNDVVLTIEPNAPDYGADYLLRYSDCLALADLIASPWVQPQIDTGCLAMVEDPLLEAVNERVPFHVHVSAPHMLPPPGQIDHLEFSNTLKINKYNGWIVLEMLPTPGDKLTFLRDKAQWLFETYSLNEADIYGN